MPNLKMKVKAKEGEPRQQFQELQGPTDELQSSKEIVVDATSSKDAGVSLNRVDHETGAPDVPIEEHAPDEGSDKSVDGSAVSVAEGCSSPSNDAAEEDDEYQPIDLDELNMSPVQIRHESRDAVETAKVSVINTTKNGKRVTFSKDVIADIGSPDKLEVRKGNAGFLFIQYKPTSENCFTLRESENKKLIYSGKLVDELTQTLQLDFNERTTVSFSKVTYVKSGGERVGFLIKKP